MVFGTLYRDLHVCPGDDDYFYWTTYSGGGTHTITATFSQAEGNIDLYLEDESGAVLHRAESNTDNESFTWTASPGLTYYVVVVLRADNGVVPGNAYDLQVE